MTPVDGQDERRLARLIEAGRGLLSELDLETVLDRLLETAAELTGARYASSTASSRAASTRRPTASSATCHAAAGCSAS